MKERAEENYDISVIIPVYNAEKYVGEAINSIIAQPFKNIEIICVDDGSTDSSPEILQKKSDEYENVKVITQKNQGVSAARNIGIGGASGRYLMFCDADDLWVPNCITKDIVHEWKNQDYDLIIMKSGVANDNLTRFVVPAGRIEKVIYGKNSEMYHAYDSHIGACVIKKELLRKNNLHFIEGVRIEEDLMFLMSCIYCADRIKVADIWSYIYRQQLGSVLHQNKLNAEQYFMPMIEGYLRMEKHCNSLNLAEKGKAYKGTDIMCTYVDKMIAQHIEEFGSVEYILNVVKNSSFFDSYIEKQSMEKYNTKFIIKHRIRGIVRLCAFKIRDNCPGMRKLRYYFKFRDKSPMILKE